MLKRSPRKQRASDAVFAAFDACPGQEEGFKAALPEPGLR